jgi:uroporphyrinogen-III decarboxylase
MVDTMTKYERVQTAWNLEEADRVPVVPTSVYFLYRAGGISIKQGMTDPDKLIQVVKENLDLVGDSIHPCNTALDHLALLPKSGWDMVSVDWRIWDDFPPDGNIPSSYFDRAFIEDYEDVMERGFASILFNREVNQEIFKRSFDDFLYYEFEYPKIYAKAWRQFVEDTGVPLMQGARATIPFEYLQYYRAFDNFIVDLIEKPDQVKQMCDLVLEYEMIRAMHRAMTMGAGVIPGAEKIFFQAGIVGPPYVSPAIFNEFVYPTLKKGVDMVVNRGFKIHIHIDGDLTSILPDLARITEGLPKGKVCLDFEKTNLKKAKEILDGKVCFQGSVPSALLVYGTPEEVDDYCKQLIEDCGPGGGFILGVECETPWDSKPENVRAMVKSVEKYGQY